MPGVVAVYTGADLPRRCGPAPMPCAWPVTAGHEEPGPLPARGRQGRATSATASPSSLARSDAEARDAVDAIVVDYEPLPAVIDLEDALLSDRVVVHDDLGTNTAYTWELKIGDEARSTRPSPPPPTRSRSATSSSASSPWPWSPAAVRRRARSPSAAT